MRTLALIGLGGALAGVVLAGPVASQQPPAVEISLAPASAQREAGTVHEVVVTVLRNGAPFPGAAVPWRVTGANPRRVRLARTGPDGRATLRFAGQRSGTDTVQAFVDRNEDAARQPAFEPEAQATVEWTGGFPQSIEIAESIDELSDPSVFQEANIAPVGDDPVYVKLPESAATASQDAPEGFIPLALAAQVPVGSVIDTDDGRVKIEATADKGGSETNTADFYDGTFRFEQPRADDGLAEMVMQGSSTGVCSRQKAGSALAARRGGRSYRRLWGSGSGRFRTTGRYASATVRGTTWFVEDRCGGTYVRSSRGTIEVRDLRRRRTITLRTNRSYFASRLSKR